MEKMMNDLKFSDKQGQFGWQQAEARNSAAPEAGLLQKYATIKRDLLRVARSVGHIFPSHGDRKKDPFLQEQ
jgi:hypothetical protein